MLAAWITFLVPINIVGFQKRWDPNPKKVSIEVEYLASEVDVSDLKAVVKLTRKNEEERQVTLNAENVELPEGLSFVRAKPNKIMLTRKP